jgi:hypothetical protein
VAGILSTEAGHYGWCPTCGKEGPARSSQEEAGADCHSHEERNPTHAKGYGIPGTQPVEGPEAVGLKRTLLH